MGGVARLAADDPLLLLLPIVLLSLRKLVKISSKISVISIMSSKKVFSSSR